VDIFFPWHLELLKEFYGSPCPCGVATNPSLSNGTSIPLVPIVLSGWDLDAQQGLFKFTMKSNAIQAMVKVVVVVTNKVQLQIVNPLICLWKMINVFQLMFHTFPKYLKLTKIIMIHVHGSLKDERCFTFMSFLKIKLYNYLNLHLQLIVVMYAQCFFTLDTFP
jgi:hypothetical protein